MHMPMVTIENLLSPHPAGLLQLATLFLIYIEIQLILVFPQILKLNFNYFQLNQY